MLQTKWSKLEWLFLGILFLIATFVLPAVTIGLNRGTITFGDLGVWVASAIAFVMAVVVIMVCVAGYALWPSMVGDEEGEKDFHFSLTDWMWYILLIVVLWFSKDEDNPQKEISMDKKTGKLPFGLNENDWFLGAYKNPWIIGIFIIGGIAFAYLTK